MDWRVNGDMFSDTGVGNNAMETAWYFAKQALSREKLEAEWGQITGAPFTNMV